MWNIPYSKYKLRSPVKHKIVRYHWTLFVLLLLNYSKSKEAVLWVQTTCIVSLIASRTKKLHGSSIKKYKNKSKIATFGGSMLPWRQSNSRIEHGPVNYTVKTCGLFVRPFGEDMIEHGSDASEFDPAFTTTMPTPFLRAITVEHKKISK